MGARGAVKAFKNMEQVEKVNMATVITMATRTWSEQQQAIFDWFQYEPSSRRHDAGDNAPLHLVVRARAGTGKTTTIIEGVNRAPEASILLCAFNKRIAEELNARITNSNAQAKTLHALGYAAIRRAWGGIRVAPGNERGDYLTAQVVGKDTPFQIKRLVTMLHTKGREMLPESATQANLTNLALEFDIVADEGYSDWPVERLALFASKAMEHAASVEPNPKIGIDFADMVYLPLVWRLLQPLYDLVVVDEAQDMTMAQLEIAQRSCSGRLCIVGDDRQAIYGFRGADSGSLDRLKAILGASELPLVTTYRCAQSIVKRAQRLVPDIQAGVSNPEGTVDACDFEQLMAGVLPGDFVLSRLNAPLVSICMRLLRDGKRAKMAGRDIGAGIEAILRKLKVTGSAPIEDVLSSLEVWERKTTSKFAAYGNLAGVDRTRDQADMIRALSDNADTADDLLTRAQWLFTDEREEGQVLCSSVHKTKGLEANRVWGLQESLYRRGISHEECNLEYVLTTRARSHLTWVTGVPGLCR